MPGIRARGCRIVFADDSTELPMAATRIRILNITVEKLYDGDLLLEGWRAHEHGGPHNRAIMVGLKNFLETRTHKNCLVKSSLGTLFPRPLININQLIF